MGHFMGKTNISTFIIIIVNISIVKYQCNLY